MPGANGVAAEETPVPAEEGIGRLGVQEQEPRRNHDYTSLMQHVNNSLNVQSISTCIPVLTPQGSILHFKALMDKFTQIECQSLTRRVLYHQQN